MDDNPEKTPQRPDSNDRLTANIIRVTTIALSVLAILIAGAALNASLLSSKSTDRVIELLEQIESNTKPLTMQPSLSHDSVPPAIMEEAEELARYGIRPAE